MLDTTYRAASQPSPDAPQAPVAKETANVVFGKEDVAINELQDKIEHSELDDWETTNGKYGLEYLGIKEIAKEPIQKMQFGMLDKFIREEMAIRGIDKTPESWQNILKEIELEIGGEKNTFKRLQRLTDYIRITKKYREIKAKKERFSNSTLEAFDIGGRL